MTSMATDRGGTLRRKHPSVLLQLVNYFFFLFTKIKSGRAMRFNTRGKGEYQVWCQWGVLSAVQGRVSSVVQGRVSRVVQGRISSVVSIGSHECGARKSIKCGAREEYQVWCKGECQVWCKGEYQVWCHWGVLNAVQGRESRESAKRRVKIANELYSCCINLVRTLKK
ncbi:hypothetical protein Btru_036796 [Bulinus truncatus]|nr:hypothetical protein Btru_036796 [Bulinus truncatus]